MASSSRKPQSVAAEDDRVQYVGLLMLPTQDSALTGLGRLVRCLSLLSFGIPTGICRAITLVLTVAKRKKRERKREDKFLLRGLQLNKWETDTAFVTFDTQPRDEDAFSEWLSPAFDGSLSQTLARLALCS